MSIFRLIHASTKSKARVGQLRTRSGHIVQTPAFVPVVSENKHKHTNPQTPNTQHQHPTFTHTLHFSGNKCNTKNN